MKKVPPTNDLMFKKLFGSDENKPLLQGLIHDVWDLDVAVEDIVIVHAYSIKAYEKAVVEKERSPDLSFDREIKLHETLRDITVVCPQADLLTEFQVRNDDFFDWRILYYAFQRFCDNYNAPGRMRLDSGGRPNRFSSLRSVKVLSILGHTHFGDDSDAFRVFDLHDLAHGASYPGGPLTVAAFELRKPRVDGMLRYWREFFTGMPLGPGAPSYIVEAEAKLDYWNLSQEERAVIDLLERAEARRETEDYTIWREGRDEGRREGRDEGQSQMIAAMRAYGLDAESIARIQELAGSAQGDASSEGVADGD